MRFLSRKWDVTKLEAGYRLVEQLDETKKAAKVAPRVMQVTAEGVHECSRDGEAKPLELIDCGPGMLARVEAFIAKTEAKS